MDANQILVLGASVLAAFSGGSAMGKDLKEPYVRVAEIEIDPACRGDDTPRQRSAT
jgi:hypothetical protein